MPGPSIEIPQSYLVKDAVTLAEYTFVALDGTTGKVTTAGVGSRPIGVVQYPVAAADVANGHRATVWHPGAISKVKAGGTVASGAFVRPDSTGRAVAASEGLPTAGVALSGTTNADALIDVLLLQPGAAVGDLAQAVLTVHTEAVAANTTDHFMLGPVPGAGTITAVQYVPSALITGADTNSRTLTLVNRGTDGSGNTTAATLALTNGVNAAAYTPSALTNGSAGNRAVLAGQYLSFTSTSVGTGIADPGGLVRVVIALS